MLSNFSVKKPYTVVVFIIIIAILGGVAYANMSVDLLPNMNLPYIAIVVVAPGSSPEDVERTISSPIEQAMATIDNVKRINSNSNEHFGLILMEFSGEVDLNSATLEIQSALVRLKSGFPDMAMDPIIMKLDPSMLAVMNIAISQDGVNINESSDYLENVGKQLLSVEGVASVSYEGLIDNLVLVMLDNDKLKLSLTEMLTPERDTFVDEVAYQAAVDALEEGEPLPSRDLFVDEIAYQAAVNNITTLSNIAGGMVGSMLQPELVGMALYAQNFNMPAGNININGMNYLVKIGDKISSLETLENMAILSVDFKKMISNYDQIIDSLRGLYVDQATLNFLKSLADEDGIAKQFTAFLSNQLDNLDESVYFEKIIDPVTGEITYKVDSSIIDGFAAISGFADSLEDFVLTAEAVASIELINNLIDFFIDIGEDEIVEQLQDLHDFLVSVRTLFIGGGIFVGTERVDPVTGEPVLNPDTNEPFIDYIVNPSIVSLFRMFGNISNTLDSIVITEQQVSNMQSTILGLNTTFDNIADFAQTIENFLQNPTYFNKIYLQDNNGNYLDSDNNITIDPNEYVVIRYTINTSLIDALKAMPPITFHVNDIGNVVVLDTSGNQFAMVNGNPGVMLAIQKQSDYSTVEVSKGVNAKLLEIANSDSDFRYIVLLDQGEFVTYMINAIIRNLLFGAFFAILVLFVFLKRIKPTLIVGSSIFVSVIAAFVMMYFAGITLNIISMGGLALGVGMLVDNSIVVIENIYRKREEGESIFDACVGGAKQVSGAIIASTITTVIIFLPIVFIEGITKQLFIDIAYTIAFSLAASLVVALTFVPMATSRILKNDKYIKESRIFEKLKDKYVQAMNFFLNKRWIVIMTVFILFFTSISSVFFMNRVFFPPSDMGFVTITATVEADNLPQDTNYYEATEIIVNHLNSTILKQEYVKDLGIEVSSGLSMLGVDAGKEFITAYVVLIDDSKRVEAYKIVEDLLSKCRSIPGLPQESYTITGTSESMDMGMMDDKKLTFNIYGEDLNDTRLAARELAILFEDVEGVNPENIDNGVGIPPLEYQLIIDPDKASIYGIYVAQALQMMQKVLAPPTAATSVRFDSTRLNYDVYVYGAEYDLIRWFKTFDSNNMPVKVFINYDGTYHIENRSAEKEEDRIIVATRQIDGDQMTNIFNYTLDDVTHTLTGEGDNMIVYYTIGRVNDIDLVTYQLTSVVLPGTEYEYSVNVPLYKILKDESFLKDDEGNVVYRIKEDDNGNPIYLVDDWGDYILDSSGNRIPDYELDADGNKIPLSIAMKEGFLSIFHEDGVRRTSVSVGIKQDANIDRVLAALVSVVDDYDPPTGVTIEVQGENPIITEAYQTMLVVLVLGVILIYLVMVAQFQSLKSPLIIMFTVPLAFTGSVFAMLITGKPISIVALVGLVILMGIVVNNGIVFVDYVNQLINDGMERRKALIKTGKDRIRPILMTALTTIFALTIMAADSSADGAMMQPMAIATIGGMIYATVLTVFFVPIMYDIFNRKQGVVEVKRETAGPVYKATFDIEPYSEALKYSSDTPYDNKMLNKKINTKGLSSDKLISIYNNMISKKREE